MPQIIQNTDFKLSNPTYNRELTTKLISQPNTTLEETEDYRIFVTGDGNSGHIGLLNKEDTMLDYMVKYQTSKKLVGLSVTQVALWRKWDSPWVQGVTSRVFFNYLLDKWPAIVSDGQQTEDGKRFWISRMAQATTLGLFVGLVDMNKDKIIWFHGAPNEFPAWLQDNKAWSRSFGNNFLRYIISK